MAQSADAVHRIRDQAKACAHPPEPQRCRAQPAVERRLLALRRPYLDDPIPPGRLCRRVEKHIQELIVLVAEPQAPPDNNAAERSLWAVVASRKISGGTQSRQATATKITPASIFGAWRPQGLNPLTACRQLLASPQTQTITPGRRDLTNEGRLDSRRPGSCEPAEPPPVARLRPAVAGSGPGTAPAVASPRCRAPRTAEAQCPQWPPPGW